MRDAMSHMAPGIILSEDKPLAKPLEQLVEECFVEPVVLPEGRVTIIDDAFVYKGRLIVPKVTERRPTTGTVLRVSDPENEYMSKLIGLRIIYGTWSGTGLSFKGESKYRILECREILGILRDQNAELESE